MAIAPRSVARVQVPASADTLTLIQQAQEGEDLAMNDLLRVIEKHHMGKIERRYYGRNVLVEQDDIASAFMEGCWRAVTRAKLDVGNPLMFIVWKGETAVWQLFRKRIRHGVRVQCALCGTSSVEMKKRRVVCGTCGTVATETHMVAMDESQYQSMMEDGSGGRDAMWDNLAIDEVPGELDATFDLFTSGIRQTEFESDVADIRLVLNGRVRELFDMLVTEDVNRDTCDNYLAEIAGRWGVTTACVSIYLRKLRVAILRYMSAE